MNWYRPVLQFQGFSCICLLFCCTRLFLSNHPCPFKQSYHSAPWIYTPMFQALLPLWGKKLLPKKSLVCHISLHFCSYIQIGQRASTVRFSSVAHCPFLGFFTNFMSPLFILSLSWDFFSSMLSSFKFPKTSEKYLTPHKSFAKSTVHSFYW